MVGLGSISMGEMPEPFQWPKDLRSLTEAQKQQLYYDYVRYSGTSDDPNVDTSPSEVIDPKSPAYFEKIAKKMQAEAEAREADQQEIRDQEQGCIDNAAASGIEYVEGVGYVCPAEEDIGALSGRMSEEALQSLARNAGITRARRPTEKEIWEARVSRMNPSERAAEERFGDI